ncbi:Uncharacterised protein [Mycobacterium tuberculosis]|uniref:Uncharacterized protein n=1 Tax=Mycobacterium tuberculosis TaxID=1773 RepID=A0A655AYB3_MYCTX|nr:Uncharacterised protein [Mycobacterium tuberculosis]CFR70113.1 Uncharacterised protein [Mycobacterium tuberculosis]CKP58930.1 Uncharacterised protein [Mycobacterium tuberculosis]CKS60331.1 Uncharacterised protein [Mycobacterium tuberculosis]CKT11263.1 Uncharacterised protein [Mycobacterium tuberculosis]
MSLECCAADIRYPVSAPVIAVMSSSAVRSSSACGFSDGSMFSTVWVT